jgi:4a-hydroxytetrahydrobiopterin dehydratase
MGVIILPKVATISLKMAEADQTPLESRHCVRCEPGTPHLDSSEIGALLGQLDGWTIEESDGHLRLAKRYKFKGFMPAVELVNRIAPIAEAEGHHPDLLVSYGSVTVYLWTHAAGGLTEDDFILAAKIDSQSTNS